MTHTEATDALIEWREQVGVNLMLAMPCGHQGEDYGDGAFCSTCFDAVQRIGAIVEAQAAHAWDQGRRSPARQLGGARMTTQEHETESVSEGTADE